MIFFFRIKSDDKSSVMMMDRKNDKVPEQKEIHDKKNSRTVFFLRVSDDTTMSQHFFP